MSDINLDEIGIHACPKAPSASIALTIEDCESGPQWYLHPNDDGVDDFPIDFCPWCGVRLQPEPVVKLRLSDSWKLADPARTCRYCGQAGHREYRVLNDDHGDEEHRCTACGKSWYIDGIDS